MFNELDRDADGAITVNEFQDLALKYDFDVNNINAGKYSFGDLLELFAKEAIDVKATSS